MNSKREMEVMRSERKERGRTAAEGDGGGYIPIVLPTHGPETPTSTVPALVSIMSARARCVWL